MKSYRSPKIENNIESISGRGTFAKEHILKGELVWVRGGTVVNYERAMELDRELGDYSLQIMDDCFLCPTTLAEVADVAIFFNHSCDPTIGVYGQVCFIALRNIEPSEELTVDYATIVAHEYRLHCRCNTAQCRQVITGDDWKLQNLQERYFGRFSHFIQEKIDALNRMKHNEQMD